MALKSTSDAAGLIKAFMAAFIEAWPTGDASRLGRYFSTDAIFHNGALPSVYGRDAIVASFEEQMALVER